MIRGEAAGLLCYLREVHLLVPSPRLVLFLRRLKPLRSNQYSNRCQWMRTAKHRVVGTRLSQQFMVEQFAWFTHIQ